MLITVFTPTYNRAYILPKLYESLVGQSYTDFEWVVVDDGSTDDTRTLMQNFIAEKKISIQFYQQQNQGKHIAINKGAAMAGGELFFTVDSDDYLLPHALQQIAKHWKDVSGLEDQHQIIGIGANRVYQNGNVIGGDVDYEVLDTDLIDYRFRKKYKGDKAEIYITEIVRAHPFPHIKGETFCPEALVYYRLANEGKQLRFVNEHWYICEYLDDGLTNSGFNTVRRGPLGNLISLSDVVKFRNTPALIKIKYAILFWRFSFWEKTKSFATKSAMMPPFYILFYPVGYFFYQKDKKR